MPNFNVITITAPILKSIISQINKGDLKEICLLMIEKIRELRSNIQEIGREKSRLEEKLKEAKNNPLPDIDAMRLYLKEKNKNNDSYFNKICFIKDIRSETGFSLKPAKEFADMLLSFKKQGMMEFASKFYQDDDNPDNDRPTQSYLSEVLREEGIIGEHERVLIRPKPPQDVPINEE